LVEEYCNVYLPSNCIHQNRMGVQQQLCSNITYYVCNVTQHVHVEELNHMQFVFQF